MANYINTNSASLNTQNNLSKNQNALATSMQRLSSGMRINSSKDDAAGYAIASRMDSVIKGQNVAIRNANDAISFSQTAEGALSKISDNFQRMRELAVQSANGTNGNDDRTSLNTEFAQLQEENTRITSNTKFNGMEVLNGDTHKFQIGSGTGASDTIEISSDNMSLSTGDTAKANVAGAYTAAVTTGTTAAAVTTGVHILSQTDATAAIDSIDAALKQVNTQVIKHGANQNRFTAVIATLNVSVENQNNARSRIMDTDYASETGVLAKNQILSQAGMAMLAQANQLPNSVMGLMR